MKFKVQAVTLSDDGEESLRDVACVERDDLTAAIIASAHPQPQRHFFHSRPNPHPPRHASRLKPLMRRLLKLRPQRCCGRKQLWASPVIGLARTLLPSCFDCSGSSLEQGWKGFLR